MVRVVVREIFTSRLITRLIIILTAFNNKPIRTISNVADWINVMNFLLKGYRSRGSLLTIITIITFFRNWALNSSLAKCFSRRSEELRMQMGLSNGTQHLLCSWEANIAEWGNQRFCSILYRFVLHPPPTLNPLPLRKTTPSPCHSSKLVKIHSIYFSAFALTFHFLVLLRISSQKRHEFLYIRNRQHGPDLRVNSRWFLLLLRVSIVDFDELSDSCNGKWVWVGWHFDVVGLGGMMAFRFGRI